MATPTRDTYMPLADPNTAATQNFPKVKQLLKALNDVGLGYVEADGPVTRDFISSGDWEIEIAGQRICPGDWIVADDDGVMVLPAAQATARKVKALPDLFIFGLAL